MAEDQVSLGSVFPNMTLWTPEGHPHLCLWPEDLLPLPGMGKRLWWEELWGWEGRGKEGREGKGGEGQDTLSWDLMTWSKNQSNAQRPFELPREVGSR